MILIKNKNFWNFKLKWSACSGCGIQVKWPSGRRTPLYHALKLMKSHEFIGKIGPWFFIKNEEAFGRFSFLNCWSTFRNISNLVKIYQDTNSKMIISLLWFNLHIKKVVHVIHDDTFRKFFGMLIICERIGTTLFLIIHAHFTLGTVQSTLFESTTLNIHINIPHNSSNELKYLQKLEIAWYSAEIMSNTFMS